MTSRCIAGLFLSSVLFATAADPLVGYQRTEDVLYGRRPGIALTFDVFEPENKNGAAVFFMVSGGFFSSHEAINAKMYYPLLERGYTVFAVVHGSQPKYQIPEITQDIHRAVRYVRYHARRWGVDPEKFGITGGSAGGHLSLTMGTQGAPGKPDAKDPVDRESSAVQAVACYFPPTDFLNYGKPGEDAVGVGILKEFKPAFGARSDTEEGRQKLGQEISPINFITAKLPPTLIIHGDADTLVPIQQATSFVKRAEEAGAVAKLITKPGAGHGWKDMAPDQKSCADWFDEHLRGLKAKE
jgi:acetyl esterase/lipase